MRNWIYSLFGFKHFKKRKVTKKVKQKKCISAYFVTFDCFFHGKI